jgi:hypothetical protein
VFRPQRFRRPPSGSYAVLSPPSFGTLPTPDSDALSSEPETILLVAEFVRDSLAKVELSDVEKQFPLLQSFRGKLFDALAVGRESTREDLDNALSYPLAAGWVVGELENESGVARAGSSQGLYWSAMVAVWNQLGGQGPIEGLHAEEAFSLQAGYYVSRIGPEGIAGVLTEAQRWQQISGDKDC